MISLDSPPTDTKYRCHWTAPLAVDPFDPKTVYYGCQVIFATSNGGQSWKVISPDLSTRDPSRIIPSGGIVGDNLGQFYGEVVFAIAPSPVQRGLIWAGTNDGKVWNTRDGGANWTDVTKNITGLPAWSVVSKIDPSNFDARHGLHRRRRAPHRRPRSRCSSRPPTSAQTWKSVSGDLPSKHPLDYTLSIAENPNRRGMLFAGTGHGFYYSLDDGGSGRQLQDGLPAAPVTWVVVQKQAHDVVLSTYGRGPLHPGRHHAARAAGTGRRRDRGAAVRAAPGVSAGAQRAGAVHLLVAVGRADEGRDCWTPGRGRADDGRGGACRA